MRRIREMYVCVRVCLSKGQYLLIVNDFYNVVDKSRASSIHCILLRIISTDCGKQSTCCTNLGNFTGNREYMIYYKLFFLSVKQILRLAMRVKEVSSF